MSPAVQAGEVDLLVREPDGEPAGALILNHGRGTDERDLYPLIDELDPERRLLGASTGAPLTGIPPGGRHWYVVERVGYPHRESFEIGFERLTAALDGFLAQRGIPWERTVVGGFSQGGVMSLAVALGKGRPTPAAAFALSSFVPSVDGWELDAGRVDGLPIYVHHGTNDPIIGIEHGRRAREILEEAEVALTYRETEAAHSLPGPVVDDLREFVAAAFPDQRDEGSA